MSQQFLLKTGIFLLLLSCLLCSLTLGSTTLSLEQFITDLLSPTAHSIVWQIRIPRTLCAFASGALLSLAGVLMQLLLQNPLADPYILGASGGAALVALMMMLFSVAVGSIFFGAFVGAMLSMLIIVSLAKKHRWQAHTLLLVGMALASIFSAGISLILIISPEKNLHTMLFWLTGDLNGREVSYLALIILILGFALARFLAPAFNILARGEKEAILLGLAVTRYRIVLYLLSAMLTAAAVSISGCIGFIGLIIPHLTRRWVGMNHSVVIPIATLLGGCLLLIADTLARILLAPTQLPVGSIIAIIGVPVFIWMLPRT